jgi:hypothetical protein
MSKHKKQHYIPRSYLKPWCDENCPANQTPYIWVFDADGNNPRRKAPDNVFHETDMYTITQGDGRRNLVLEHGLRDLEDQFCRIRKKKLQREEPLDAEEHDFLCAFVAAMHSRTPAIREHWRKQWSNVLAPMDKMKEWLDKASPEQRRRAMQIPSISPEDDQADDTLSMEDVKKLYENPLQTMLASLVSEMVKALVRMRFAVLNAPQDHYFLTSDAPCILFDPSAYRRPPIYRSPGLYHPQLEITLPVSPTQTVFFSRHPFEGYNDINAAQVDGLNQRTRFRAYQHFIFNKNYINPIWFDPGVEPEDSWEKTRGTRTTNSPSSH